MRLSSYITLTLLSILAVVVQLSIVNYFSSSPAFYVPIILIILFSVSKTALFAISQSILMGVLLDVFSPLQFGTYTILFLLLTGLAYLLLQTILSQRSLVTIFSLGVIGVLFFDLVLELIQYISSLGNIASFTNFFHGSFFLDTLLTSLITSLLIIFFYKLGSLRRGFRIQPYVIK